MVRKRWCLWSRKRSVAPGPISKPLYKRGWPVHVEAIPRLRESAPAVQAAMLVLGRRKKEEPNLPLGLMGTDLRRLRLSDVDIPDGANLAHVLLWRASLINASLKRANLCEAKLGWTDLRHSGLKETDLRRADLRGEIGRAHV